MRLKHAAHLLAVWRHADAQPVLLEVFREQSADLAIIVYHEDVGEFVHCVHQARAGALAAYLRTYSGTITTLPRARPDST